MRESFHRGSVHLVTPFDGLNGLCEVPTIIFFVSTNFQMHLWRGTQWCHREAPTSHALTMKARPTKRENGTGDCNGTTSRTSNCRVNCLKRKACRIACSRLPCCFLLTRFPSVSSQSRCTNYWTLLATVYDNKETY